MGFDTRLGAGIRQLGNTDDYRMLRGKDVDLTEADPLNTLEDADIFLVDEAAAGTQASTNKITAANVKTYMQSGLSSGITFSGSTANGLVTFGDASTANVESNLTFDGNIFKISSGTSGDATLVISADTDNDDENDNARLWFKQDGDITEGAIQMSSNVLNIINNISGAGGISFRTGTTNNTGTSDPAIGAAERMSIASNGTVSVAGNLSSNTLGVTQGITSDSSLAYKVTARIRENNIPTAATASSGLCEIITQGSVYGGGSLTAGKVYQLTADTTNSANMSWKPTNASGTSTSSGLLAMALGTNPSNGMLLRGVVVIESNLLGSVNPGTTLYLRTADGGIIQTPPNSSGNCQRIIGHFLKTTATDGDRMIHFNPSQEFITLA